jgi:hypothetical protein
VIADNQEHLVQLPKTLQDTALGASIISKQKALASQGAIKTSNPLSLTTSTGQCYASSSTITLRWRYDAALQSFTETFWIVDGCGGYDAILRKDIEGTDSPETPKAFPMQFGKPGKAGEKEKQGKTRSKQDKEAQYQKELESQKALVRQQLEAMKMQQQGFH